MFFGKIGCRPAADRIARVIGGVPPVPGPIQLSRANQQLHCIFQDLTWPLRSFSGDPATRPRNHPMAIEKKAPKNVKKQPTKTLKEKRAAKQAKKSK